MNKKEAAITFFQMVCDHRVKEAYDKFIAAGFKHHNAWYKGDRQTLMTGMEENNKTHPNKKFDVKHVYQDGDTVILHSLVVHTPGAPGVAVVHILRFEGDKVAEMWDLGQPLNADSPNENGPF